MVCAYSFVTNRLLLLNSTLSDGGSVWVSKLSEEVFIDQSRRGPITLPPTLTLFECPRINAIARVEAKSSKVTCEDVPSKDEAST